MAVYHLDCASGLAGDMFLGACLDLGMPLAVVADTVARLGLPGVTVESRKAARGGFVGTRFRVLLDGRPLEGPDPEEGPGPHEAGGGHGHEHPRHGTAGQYQDGRSLDSGSEAGHQLPHTHDLPAAGSGGEREHAHGGGAGHRHSHVHDLPAAGSGGGHAGQRDLRQIRALLQASDLAPAVRERARRLFDRLGEAEAQAHGLPVERVHFHEVGAVDSIVDLVGAAAAIEYLAPERLTCGPVNVGSGRVRTEHGALPVPAPATAELLRGVPIHGGPGGELTTPTGAVLLAELVDEFQEIPKLVLEATGYGLGRREIPTHPNVTRLLRGRAGVSLGAAAAGPEPAQVAVLECEIDDLSGEGFGFLMERLLAAGALDVYFTPVTMKKSRPGVLVTALCRTGSLEPLAGLLLLESGSLGCRYHIAARFEAERESAEVATAFGRVRIKRGRLAGRPLATAPEFEDCRRLALAGGVPWREVYRAALAALAAAPAGAPAGSRRGAADGDPTLE